MEDYVGKYQLKIKGMNLEKEDTKQAIDFYTELLHHKYFINDYYPYRRLVILYKKTREFDKKVNIIRCFFKSEIYCNKRNYLWFRNKLRLYSKKGFITTGEIDELTNYFKTHALKNKEKSNHPVPIAERLRIDRGKVRVISQETYDNSQKVYELEEIGLELKRQGKYDEFIDLYIHMIDDLGYRSYRYYKSLAIAYGKIGDYESELKIINRYYEDDTTKTDSSNEWFDKRLKEVSNKSDAKHINPQISEIEQLRDENKRLKKQIRDLEKQIKKYESNSSKIDSKPQRKQLSNNLGIEDTILYEFPINENFEIELEEFNEIYEFDDSLSEKLNIYRKLILKEYGRKLTYDKEYSQAIEFYNNLKENSYFKNDWFPYRQLSIIHDRNKNYNDNLENIKDLFLSGIYLNKYQYVWFTNKIKKIMENMSINESEFQKWLDYYGSNGSQNKSKLNNVLADQMVKQDEMFKVLDKESFEYRQEIYGLEEIGMTSERVGNYELAIAHYKNIIDEGKYNIYKFYQRICLCLEKLKDYPRELDAIKLYYAQPPLHITEFSDEWFEKRLMKVNSKLGTNYTVNEILREQSL